MTGEDRLEYEFALPTGHRAADTPPPTPAAADPCCPPPGGLRMADCPSNCPSDLWGIGSRLGLRPKSEYGGRGIRTPEGLHLSGFQDHRHRPLGHPSGEDQ